MESRVGLAKHITSRLRQVTDIKTAKLNADVLDSKSMLTDIELLEIGLSRLEDGKNFELPIKYCEQALTLKPSPGVAAECHYVLAVALHQLKKDMESSLRHFLLALAKCEADQYTNRDEYLRIKSKTLRNLGLYFLPKEKYIEAAEYFRQSLEIAKESPVQLKGFISAMTAYYALTLCKQGLKDEGFKQFADAKALYQEFPATELEVSMDYASFYVHQGRIYLQKREYAQAVTVLEKGYDLRIKNLQAETPGEIHSYNDNRIGAVASLLKEAYARLAETGTLLPPIATISQTGSPLHSRRTAPAHSSSVSEADLAATQRRNNM